MTCATLAAIAGAVILPLRGEWNIGPDADQLVLAPHPTAVAELCYENHAAQVSAAGDFQIVMGSLTVSVRVDIEDAERITVTVPEGMQVYPADAAFASVPDGESIRMLIVQGMM